MENKKLISYSLIGILLLTFGFYSTTTMYAEAVTIEFAVLGGTSAISINRNCEYVSSSLVLCPTGSGAKGWNPTTRTLVYTLNSTSSITDVVCGTFCYVWVASGVTGVLSKYTTSGTIVNSTTFTSGAGSTTGIGIGIVSEQGAENIFLPIEGQACAGAVGGTNEKGICIWDGISDTGSRFITTSCTNDACVNWDVEWNGGLASVGNPSGNRIVVKNQDAVGAHRYYVLNLADSDNTFSTTEICNSGVVAGGFSIQSQMVIVNEVMYDPINNDLYTFDTSLNTCAETLKSNLVDESLALGISYSSTDDLFFVMGNTDGAVETTSVNVFNGSNFDLGTSAWTKVLKLNTTVGADQFNWASWVHQSEGELHVWQGSNVMIITDLLTVEEPDPNTEFCEIPANFNLLRCVLERGDTTPLVGSSELVNQSSTNIVCQIGLIACTQNEDGNFTPDNPDIQTNGVGYLLLIIALGITIGVFWVASRGDLGSIPTFVWILATLSIIGVMTAFDWIDPTILIVAIIAIIALATAKAKGIFGSSGLFAGDT